MHIAINEKPSHPLEPQISHHLILKTQTLKAKCRAQFASDFYEARDVVDEIETASLWLLLRLHGFLEQSGGVPLEGELPHMLFHQTTKFVGRGVAKETTE